MIAAAPVPKEDASMALEREMQTFHRELPALLAEPRNRGQFALIRGDRVEAIEPTLDEALRRGYERFNLDPFMVKQIENEEPVYFTRDVIPCQS